MKINNLSLPYPVLGHNDDVDAVCDFKYEPKVTTEGEFYIVDIETDVRNHDIVKHVRDGAAIYICEVQCQRTLLRRCEKSDTGTFNFKLRKDEVADVVNFFVAIVAIKPIVGYTNKRFHEDYAGFSFDLEAGDLMACFKEFSYDAGIKYDRLKRIGTIIHISESKELDFPATILGGDKIDIKLPADLYSTYQSYLMNNTDYSHIIHSSLVYNALFQALMSYEEHRETQWARTIKYRVENENSLQEFSKIFENRLEAEDIARLAQKILLNPYKRLFNTLKEMDESNSAE